MREHTECWLSRYSYADEETLGPTLLKFMLGRDPRAPWPPSESSEPEGSR
jgi:hypothetical protein